MDDFESIVKMVSCYSILCQENISSDFIAAREICFSRWSKPYFLIIKPLRKKRLFKYEVGEETPLDPEELFKIEVFALWLIL